jgi:molybdopterin converting factor small subunit
MQVTLKYFAQVRQAAEVESEPIEVPEGADAGSAITKAAQGRSDAFRTLVLDEDARVRSSLLVLVNSEPVPRNARIELKAGDEICIFSPIAGG